MLYRILFFLVSLSFFTASNGQNCNYDEMTRKLIESQPEMEEEIMRFEAKRSLLAEAPAVSRMETIIPVVVHVIHSGEAVGVGANVSVNRINSQLEILNDDFQRMNADANQTPSQFQGVAANTGIQFGLAQISPSGTSTSGITRHQYNNIPNTDFIESTIKPNTTWDPLNYLNIWVVDLPSSTIIGYSYLPTNTMVGSNRDGLVVTNEKFGYINSTNRGRTATHEIGHYLGLQHIWGPNDNNGDPIGCGADDELSDTPNQDGPYYGCPNGGSSCGSTDMNMNYMDYVDDYCMNLFTDDQSNVMNNILNGIRQELIEGNLTGNVDDCISVANDYNFGFEPSQAASSWTAFNANGDDRTWVITDQSTTDWGPNEGVGMAVYLWNPDAVTAADDYLFSPCLSLKKGHDYRLSFSMAVAQDASGIFPEKLEVGFSAQKSSNDFYTLGNDWIFNPVDNAYPNYQDVDRVFTINNDKELSIGFHVFSDADQYAMQIDDIKIVDLGLVSTQDLANNELIDIFPNPTQGIAEIFIDAANWKNEVELQVFNSLGALVIQEVYSTNQTKKVLDLTEQAAGVYFCRILDGENHSIQRIVKH